MKPSYGYRAVHVIVTVETKPVEVQIRTELQHNWALATEKLADVFDHQIKYGGGPAEIQAADEDTVRRTHKRYFQTTGELVESMMQPEPASK